MTDAIFWRLVWKEYRVQRGFWLALVGFAVVLQLIVVFNPGRNGPSLETLLAIAAAIPAFYALGSAAVTFASEHEDGTTEMLRALAPSPARLLGSKLAFSAISTVAMLSLLWLVAVWIFGGRSTTHVSFDFDSRTFFTSTKWVACVVGFLVLGVFFSLLSHNVLTAVILAAGTTVVSTTMLLRFAEDWLGHSTFSTAKGQFLTWLVGGVAVLGVLVADYVLTQRWLTGPRRESPLGRVFHRERATARTKQIAVLGYDEEEAPSSWRLIKRLVWQEWPHVWRVGLLCFAVEVPIVIAVFLLGGNELESWRYRTVAITLVAFAVPALLGIWSFRAEQQSRRFRFLAERGVGPCSVWLSKHLVWFPMACAFTLGLFLMVGILDSILNPPSPGTIIPEGMGRLELSMHRARSLMCFISISWISVFNPASSVFLRVTLVVLNDVLSIAGLAYSAGQLVSMLLSRTVTALTAGFVLLLSLLWWCWTMAYLQVPPVWSVAPIPIILLAATLIRARDWMIENHSAGSWVKVAVSVVLPGSVILISVSLFRAYEIPVIGAQHELKQPITPVTTEAREVANIYRSAIAEMTDPRDPIFPDEDRPTGTILTYLPGHHFSSYGQTERLRSFERKWVRENSQTIARTLEAAKNRECAFVDPTQGTRDQPATADREIGRCRGLGLLLLLSARELEAEGELDEALDRYLAALRVGRHIAQHGVFEQFWVGRATIDDAFRRMDHWAAHPQQTVDRIRRAIQGVEDETSDWATLADAIKNSHRTRWQPVFVGWENIPRSYGHNYAAYPCSFLAWPCGLCPWEEVRKMRAQDALYAHLLVRSREAQQRLESPSADMGQWFWSTFGSLFAGFTDREYSWIRSTPLLRDGTDLPAPALFVEHLTDAETQRRALLITLGLAGWRLEHGELPQRLDALIGTFLDTLPLDPWSGRQFQYFPEGLVATLFSYRHRLHPNRIQPGQPLLWSVGREQVRLVPNHRDDTGQMQVTIGRRYDRMAEKYRTPPPKLPQPGYGMAFPIP